jgi:acetoin:2,6-dichlorophenolindophenol oxidoreductase subunit alpha
MREPGAAGAEGRNVDLARLRLHHATMLRIRAFEELALGAAREGLVHGAIHPSIGQEAVASGVCLNLARDDVLLTTHRGHGHALAKGADPTAMMCELLGREGGTCQGKGGSMHIADLGVAMLGANGVVGANIEIAAGAAHAVRLLGLDRVVCCIFGDGAINRGPFLEGLNWAKVFDLPLLLVCEDNGFAATTRTGSLSAGAGALSRAEALGIPGEAVDGNDVQAVDEATARLLAAVRAGEGPRLLLATTYRLMGHTAADPATYRSAEEVEGWRRSDPIARVEAFLREAGVGEDALAKTRADARAALDAAYAAARAAPWPDMSLLAADVQDVGDPRERPF